jgi:hypothetical protein
LRQGVPGLGLLPAVDVPGARDELVEAHRQGEPHVGAAGELEVIIGDRVAVGVGGRRPPEDDVGAVGLPAVGRVDGRRWCERRARRRPLDPAVRDAHPAVAGRLVGVGERVVAHDHLRQRQRRHLEVVQDRQAP